MNPTHAIVHVARIPLTPNYSEKYINVGTGTAAAKERRRARNKAARRSRRINRRTS